MPGSSRPSAVRFASAPLTSEEERALLQERIALYAKTAALLSYGFLFIGNGLAIALSERVKLSKVVAHPPAQLHFAAATVASLVWLVTRRGRLGHVALDWLDVGVTLVPMACYAGMATSDAVPITERIDLVLMLIAMVTLTMRATIVPSSPKQTAVVGAAACVPVVLVAWHQSGQLSPPTAPIVYVGLWSVVSVIVTTLASRVIFGLRERAAEAQRLGQYVLVEKIGGGGMGTVYRARHALLRRPTAIKLLPPDKLGAQTISRFEREVQNTSRLTHPNTVAIYDYGRTPDGVFYYAMEYLDGVDLQQLVHASGPQSPSRVVHVLAQVCGALTEAHGIGLVHRDIKPANIVLCERGGIPDTAKVVDFGLVKDVASAKAPTLSTADTIIGTPMYMAPEAIQKPDAVDARADLYALAAVGYFLLTGKTVFEGSSVMEVCAQHLHEAPVPPSTRLGSPLPEDLEALILKCLAKNPAERLQSAAELRRALLDCAVPRWTEVDARGFWKEHPGLAAFGETKGAAASPTALTVDFDKRTPGQFLSPSK